MVGVLRVGNGFDLGFIQHPEPADGERHASLGFRERLHHRVCQRVAFEVADADYANFRINTASFVGRLDRHNQHIINTFLADDACADSVQFAELIGRALQRVQHKPVVEPDVVERFRIRIEADRLTDASIVIDALFRRESCKIAFDDDLLDCGN